MQPRQNGRTDEDATAREPEEWARSLRKGEPEAVREVRRRIARIVSYRGLGVAAADRGDLEQEIMIQVWQAANRPGFDVAAGFWGFVEVVTSRRCIDWLRSRRDWSSVDVDDLRSPDHGPFDEAVARDRQALASDILSRLGDECRQLIRLRLGEGVAYARVAEITGKSEGALRVQLHRCIGQARRIANKLTASSTVEQEDQE